MEPKVDKPVVTIVLRVPGNWSDPGQLIDRLPDGYQLTPKALLLPDGTEIEFAPMPPDDQFAGVFRTACRSPANAAELTAIDSYSVNVVLRGPGGSRDAARTMMRVGAAIVEAGGSGVFVDNSAIAHGGQGWLDMSDDGGSDAMSFAYVSVIDSAEKIWTMGMHIMGLPDIELPQSDGDGDVVIDVLRYVCDSNVPVGHGHIIANENGPQFRVVEVVDDKTEAGSPMHNPWGRLCLKSIHRIAEQN